MLVGGKKEGTECVKSGSCVENGILENGVKRGESDAAARRSRGSWWCGGSGGGGDTPWCLLLLMMMRTCRPHGGSSRVVVMVVMGGTPTPRDQKVAWLHNR